MTDLSFFDYSFILQSSITVILHLTGDLNKAGVGFDRVLDLVTRKRHRNVTSSLLEL